MDSKTSTPASATPVTASSSPIDDACPACSCPEEGMWVTHRAKPCPHDDADARARWNDYRYGRGNW